MRARSRERWTPAWKPFEGKLSPRSQAHALTVLRNLYRFLNNQNYLAGNPWAGVEEARTSGPKINVGRSLTEDQWAFALDRLGRLPRSSSNLRLQIALPLLYASGVRLSEIVSAKTSDLEWRSLALPVPASASRDGGCTWSARARERVRFPCRMKS